MGQILATSRTRDVLAEVGARLREYRLQRNLRVEDLSLASGVSERTLNRMEAGHSVGTENLVRALRGLGRLQSLDAFLSEPEVSPLQLARLGGKRRRRASGGDRG